MGRGFGLSTGRLIALGRLLLAALFLFALWLDARQPDRAARDTYLLLILYVGFAVGIVVATWRDWWLEAKLAGPAHAADILLFTLLVLTTTGYASPFFSFFIFLLLVAALRWGWFATALTGGLLILLYLGAGGLVLSAGAPFSLQDVIIRTGQLISVTLILLWFGANRLRTRLHLQDEGMLGQPSLDEPDIEKALEAVMRGLRASKGLFAWRESGRSDFGVVALGPGESRRFAVAAHEMPDRLSAPLLYDIARNRALCRDRERNLRASEASAVIPDRLANRLGLSQGLAIRIRTDSGEGLLFAQSVRGLSVDHIDIGEQVGAEVAGFIERGALLRATDENAEARSRLSLARDLHDSVVQFLAGAAFRLEAMKRSQASGRDLAGDLDELKQLMLHEQGELRAFITVLRSGSETAFADLAQDLKSLAERLSRQWSISCEVAVRRDSMSVPTRLQIDLHQLMREAVANAVRHADAKRVRVKLEAEAQALRMVIANDGADLPMVAGKRRTSASLEERVLQAGGEIDVARGLGMTRVAITLPVRSRTA